MIDFIILAALFTGMNHSNDEEVIPFPVEKDGVTFCYHVNQKIKGEAEKFVECNYVQMPKYKIDKLRDHLDNWTSGR